MLFHLQGFVLPALLLVEEVSLYLKISNQFTLCEFVILFWNARKLLTAVAPWGNEFHSSQNEVARTWLIASKGVFHLWPLKRKIKMQWI